MYGLSHHGFVLHRHRKQQHFFFLIIWFIFCFVLFFCFFTFHHCAHGPKTQRMMKSPPSSAISCLMFQDHCCVGHFILCFLCYLIVFVSCRPPQTCKSNYFILNVFLHQCIIPGHKCLKWFMFLIEANFRLFRRLKNIGVSFIAFLVQWSGHAL